jgi:hypothetical protein
VLLKNARSVIAVEAKSGHPAKTMRIRRIRAQSGAVTVKTVSRKGILRPFEVDRGQHIRRVKTLPMLRAAAWGPSGRLFDGKQTHRQVCQVSLVRCPALCSSERGRAHSGKWREPSNCAIIVSRRAALGLTALAGGFDHVDLFIPVRSLPEDLLAANDHGRTRQKAGQVSEVRQSEGSAALRGVRG